MDINSALHWTPAQARDQIRTKSSMQNVTNSSLLCLGYVQSNIAIVPSAVADDLSEFCRLNNAPCPLLYRSKKGEVSAGPLARDSDIRTDLNRYIVYKKSSDGTQEKSTAWQLKDYQWHDMVTFYTGCSYSFQDALIKAGVPVQNIDDGVDASLFTTNIKCISVGRIVCPGMVVSMRPIRKDLIQKAVSVTARYDAVHGAPIHIGDPSMIGIRNILKPELGDPSHFDEDQVALFWGCGHTSAVAVELANLDISFSHSVPGTLFITDVTTDEYFKEHPSAHGDEQPVVVPLQDDPYYASILGEKTLETINQLEEIILDDPGSKASLHKHGELVQSALRVSHANSVAIVIVEEDDVPIERNGLSDILTMVPALQAFGKNVTLVVSPGSVGKVRDVVAECMKAGILQNKVNIEELGPNPGTFMEKSATHVPLHEPGFDVIIAVKRTNKEIRFAKDMDQSERLKRSISTIVTRSVGRNEIAMAILNQTNQHVQKGSDNSCKMSVNHVTSGCVFGGWAVIMAVFMLQNCLLHSRYRRYGIGEHRVIPLNVVTDVVKQYDRMLELFVSSDIPMPDDKLRYKFKQMTSIINKNRT